MDTSKESERTHRYFLDRTILKPRIYGWSCALCLLVCVIAAASIPLPEKYKEPFVWIMFCVPFLWVLWFCCVLCVRGTWWLRKISIFWGLINAAIIIFIASFSGLDGWQHSRDGDVVMLTLYSPIAFPLMLVLPSTVLTSLSAFVDLFAKVLGGGGKAYFIAIWCGLSALSLLEAFVVFLLSKLLFWGSAEKKRDCPGIS